MRPRARPRPEEVALGLDQDPVTLSRLWMLERVGWALIALIVVAAAAGATGRGWLSAARVKTPAAEATLRYERVTRLFSDTELDLTCPARAVKRDTVVVTMDSAYSVAARIQQIVPPPVTSSLTNTGVRYAFVSHLVGPALAVFQLQPLRPGVQRGSLACGDGSTLSFTQLVLP